MPARGSPRSAQVLRAMGVLVPLAAPTAGLGEALVAITTVRTASGRSDRRQRCRETRGIADVRAVLLHSRPPPRHLRALDCPLSLPMISVLLATGTHTPGPGRMRTNCRRTRPTRAIQGLDPPVATRLWVLLMRLHRRWSASGCSSTCGDANRSVLPRKEPTTAATTDTRDGSGWLPMRGPSCGAASSRRVAAP